jgi:hypothetical protein
LFSIQVLLIGQFRAIQLIRHIHYITRASIRQYRIHSDMLDFGITLVMPANGKTTLLPGIYPTCLPVDILLLFHHFDLQKKALL